jgi:hypothetical protein
VSSTYRRTITLRGNGAAAIPEHELAKASIFLRHHIQTNLKMEYPEVCDPLTLWLAPHERFGK